MSKRIITLGTWNKKPIEWVVLSEDDSSILVISRYEISRRYFDSSSSNNNWGSSDLRKFLNGDFYRLAFSQDEKKKIINTKLTDPDNAGVKDDVFILTRDEMKSLLLKDGDDDYERSYYSGCNYCTWTRTKEGNGVIHGYAKGCWCCHYANCTYAVRPAMRLRKW